MAEQFVKIRNGVAAPKGFHYMPNGKLMNDADHIAMFGYIDKKIDNFNFNSKDISFAGETRSFSVEGDSGAVFSLEIYDDDATPNYYDFITQTWSTTKSGLYNIEIQDGAYEFNIVFPTIQFTDATCDYNNDPTIAHANAFSIALASPNNTFNFSTAYRSASVSMSLEYEICNP